MKFARCAIEGAFIVDLEPQADERGYFARTYCREEFERHGLTPDITQCSVSQNRLKGTLRGMHYQAAPDGEAKLVRCTRGALFDVIVDLRPGSPSYRRWLGVELDADQGRMLFIPEGCAHGFLTLRDDTHVYYQISTPFRPASARGFRWDDPSVGIAWPGEPTVISDKDRALPYLAP